MHHLRYVLGDDAASNSVSHKDAAIIVPHFEVSITSINLARKSQPDQHTL